MDYIEFWGIVFVLAIISLILFIYLHYKNIKTPSIFVWFFGLLSGCIFWILISELIIYMLNN